MKYDEALKLSMSHKTEPFSSQMICASHAQMVSPKFPLRVKQKQKQHINTHLARRWKKGNRSIQKCRFEIFQNQQDEENKFHLHIILIDMFTQCVFNSETRAIGCDRV